MTSITVRQTAWFQSQKWFTDIHFDKAILQEVSKTHPAFKDLIHQLEKDDTALVNEDADWASRFRLITGMPLNSSDHGRSVVASSVSRATKTILAYRALDIACYVLELAPAKKSPLPSPLPLAQTSAVLETLNSANWVADILEMEQLLEAHWAQPSVAASSSTSASSSNTLTSTYPASNSTTEQIIQSMRKNMDLSNSGRRSEKVQRFLASFYEVSAVMGYIISEGTTHLPNLPAKLIAHCGKPASNDVTLSYVLSASTSPIMLFTKYNPNMKDAEKYLNFWSHCSFDDSFRVVDKALWTAVVHVMMGHLDAKAALRRFFNDSRDILNASTANVVNPLKRHLPTEDISNDKEATQDRAAIPASKKRKRYPPDSDFSHQPTQPHSLNPATASLILGQGANDAGHGASPTSATPVAEPQDQPRTPDPQNEPDAPQPDDPASPDPPMPTNAQATLDPLNVSTAFDASTVTQDPGTNPHAPTSLADERMDVDEPNLVPAVNVGSVASPVGSPTPTPARVGGVGQIASPVGSPARAVNVGQVASPVDSLPRPKTPTPVPAVNVGQVAPSHPTTPTQPSSGSTTTPTQKTHSTPLSHSPPHSTPPTAKTVDLRSSTTLATKKAVPLTLDPPPSNSKTPAPKNKDPPAKRIPPSASTSAPKKTQPSKSGAKTPATKKTNASQSQTRQSNPRATGSQTSPVTKNKAAASRSAASTSRPPLPSNQTTSEKSTATQNETGRCNPPATSPVTKKTTGARESAASSSRRSLPSKKNDALLKGSHEIKKEEDRLNHVLADKAQDKKSAARVIYYDTKEFQDWPEIDKNGAMEAHNVVFASESVCYPIVGSDRTHHYQSAGHSADANTWFKNLYERSDIIDITANATQTVVHYPKQNFNTPDSFDLQGTFKKHHILVTDNSYVAPKFDKAALVNILKSESRPFPFIDQSEPEEVTIHKTLKDFLDQVQSDDGSLKKSGRIFTILKTPTTDGPHPDSRIATDIQAFHATVDRPLCYNRTFPLAGNQWATICTPHAVQQYHDGGLGTFIYLEIGYLFLFIAKSDPDDEISLATKPFDQQTFQVALLAPGSTIYLRPGTVYYSVSSTACAIRGGHFMSVSTLRATALGLLKNFDMSSTQLTSSLDMIRYIVTMFHGNWILKAKEDHLVYHLPNIKKFDGMLDVLHVCVIAELGAILYAPRYVGDVVNYSDKHRKSFIRCRDLAHEIVLHLDASYQIKSSSGRLNQVAVFYFKFLVKQVQAFWLQQSKTRPSSGTGPKQLDAIAEAIARLFHGNEQFWKEWAKCSQPEQRSSLRYGLLGKGYTLTPTFSKIRSGRSQAREQFYQDQMASPEDEDEDEELDPEIRNRVAEMKGWAKN